jgi:hypothetical protein
VLTVNQLVPQSPAIWCGSSIDPDTGVGADREKPDGHCPRSSKGRQRRSGLPNGWRATVDNRSAIPPLVVPHMCVDPDSPHADREGRVDIGGDAVPTNTASAGVICNACTTARKRFARRDEDSVEEVTEPALTDPALLDFEVALRSHRLLSAVICCVTGVPTTGSVPSGRQPWSAGRSDRSRPTASDRACRPTCQ